jgi:hypothetical protein
MVGSLSRLGVWVAVVILLGVGACTGPEQRPGFGPAAYIYDTGRYGEFCGPDYPDTSRYTTPAGKKRMLDTLYSGVRLRMGRIDTACYMHDVCYAVGAETITACDLRFIETMNAMQFDDWACSFLRDNLVTAIETKVRLQTDDGSYLGHTWQVVKSALMNTIESLGRHPDSRRC